MSLCNPFEDKVKCKECRCWLDKHDAQEVVVTGWLFIGDDYYRYYCASHTKPYFKKFVSRDCVKYFAKLEVDEQGVPFGYIKWDPMTPTAISAGQILGATKKRGRPFGSKNKK